ncbi:MAG: outer membrane protein assembly factor BamA [Deltaproteobacteria bacterium]|nr:outer membrane protein assembly factor BamA [Deltaproteobacteria bacterium]
MFLKFFLIIILVVFNCAHVFAGPMDIVSIDIQGNKKIEKAAILLKVHSKSGMPLNKDVLREDIRSIFSMGYFDEVEVAQEEVPGGVRIVFEVKEKPIIARIEYQGLDAIDKDDLKDIIQVKEYEVLDINKLHQSVEKLTAKYEEKGHYLADVRFEVIPDISRNEATVIFHIEENDKIQVKNINIIGNHVISSEDLKNVMQTKEGGPMSWLTGSGSFREAVFERDIAAMGFYYGTLGYVRARFGKPEVSVSADKKWIYITFSVDEGQQYNVGKVDFSGELLFNRQELVEDLKLIQGDIFNTETLRRETLKYTEKYSDLGYAFANVVPQPVIHDDTRTVDVTFDIDKGERVFIGKITITGNTRTKDKVIRRELLIHEGELFNGTKKRESKENVTRLGFFDSVEFHQSASKDDSRVVDIDIRVKERSTGQLVIGAGYASGDIGFTAQAQLSQNNFLGNGQVASLSAQMLTGRRFYEFNIGFQEPYVGYSYWSLGGHLYHLRRILAALQNVNTFEETKSGFDIQLGHPVLEFTNLYLTYKLENSYVPADTIIDRALIPPESVNGLTSGLTTSIVYDKRDDRFDPREGLYLSLSTEYAGLGGARKYVRSRGTTKYFHPIVWDFVFRFNLTGANITQVGDTPVPLNELFIQGGLFSLRGYDYLTVGPRARLSTDPTYLSDKAKEANLGGKEIVMGGHNEVLVNAEVEFPILKEARIRGVLFLDAGNAFEGFFRNASPALLADVGYGIRWFTPIGPLRFEFGYPIVQGGPPKFYFTIGPPF